MTVDQRKLKALVAEGRSGWASSSFLSGKSQLIYVNSFLIGCPAHGTSAASKHLDALDNTDNSSAAELLCKIKSGIETDRWLCSAELRQVARSLINNRLDGGGVPRGGREFAFFSRSPAGILKDHYGLFPDVDKTSLSAVHAKPYDRVLELDSFFRHLRNGLAHGLTIEVQRKSPETGKVEGYLYIQDNNRYSQISARMFLSRSRLERISKMLKD